jgi:hypothetical protein
MDDLWVSLGLDRQLSLRAASAGPGLRLSCLIGADGADGADGIPEGLAHRNDPGSGAAFTTEGNLDA